MIARRLLSHILEDEALTRGISDPEARMLVEWLVDQAERLASPDATEAAIGQHVYRLCARGRAISRFVRLWCYGGDRSAALQLAGTERFAWPLPWGEVQPCQLMHDILDWETRSL